MEHRRHKGLNNRAEHSHRPTRRRARGRQRFKSPEHAQQFLGLLGPIADLIHKHRAAAVPVSVPGSDAQAFLDGRVAIDWTNVGIVNALKKQAQGVVWQALLGPKGPKGRGFFMGVNAPGINAATKYPQQAFELVKYIVSKDVSFGWFEAGFPPGGRRDTWNDPRVVADPAFKTLARAMDASTPFNLPENGLIADYNSALGKELNAVWAGQTSAKDGVEAARRAGQDVLDRAAG